MALADHLKIERTVAGRATLLIFRAPGGAPVAAIRYEPGDRRVYVDTADGTRRRFGPMTAVESRHATVTRAATWVREFFRAREVDKPATPE